MTIQCESCGKLLPETSFRKSKNNKRYRVCKPCVSSRSAVDKLSEEEYTLRRAVVEYIKLTQDLIGLGPDINSSIEPQAIRQVRTLANQINDILDCKMRKHTKNGI